MREIKFRNWMPHNKKMSYSEKEPSMEAYWAFAEGNGELMQYTGLKDKEGREIYEGDIIVRKDSVRPSGPYHVQDVYYEIYYAEEYGMYMGRNKTDYYYTLELLELKDHKVIGNIYENPELIEG